MSQPTRRSSTQPAGRCPDDCKQAMAIAQEDVDRIKRQGPAITDFDMANRSYREVPGEIVRNGHITRAYTQLARDMPQNDWVRLASYVSVQGGCAMRQFWNPSQSGVPGAAGFAQNGLTALGQANVAIFESIYPPNRMAANCGIEKFLECVRSGEIRVNPAIVQAMERMQAGDNRGAANAIANYEQRNVVQPVYERWSGTFRAMEAVDSVNVFQDMTSIPIAKTCTRDNLVPLRGSISDPNARVRYYGDLLDRMYEIEGR
jgi:hypothetical protein